MDTMSSKAPSPICKCLSIIKQIMKDNSPALDYDYRQLEWAAPAVSSGVGARRQLALTCWMAGGDTIVNGDDTDNDDATNHVFFDSIQRLNGDGQHAVALSTVRNELSVWNFETGQCVKGNQLKKY